MMELKNIEIDEAKEKNVIHVEINYPRNSQLDTIEIGLCEVRAADDIRIKYDFKRDGWVIYQSRTFYPNGEGFEEEWIESAFCPAWKYELPEEEKDTYRPKKRKNNE